MRVRINDFLLGLVFTINISQVLFLKVSFCIGTYLNALAPESFKNVRDRVPLILLGHVVTVGTCCLLADLRGRSLNCSGKNVQS